MNTPSLSQGNDRDLLLISVFTFFTVTLWVFFEVLKTVKTTTIAPKTTQSVIQLSPKLDSQVVETIKMRKTY